MNLIQNKNSDRGRYLSIAEGTDGGGGDNENESRNIMESCSSKRILITAAVSLCATLAALDWINLRFFYNGASPSFNTVDYESLPKEGENWKKLGRHHHSHSKEVDKEDEILMPGGVNIGSWLSLEDWFYVGEGAIEVATPFGDTAASCLPPLHVGPSTGPRWNSETDLLANFSSSPSSSLAHALRVFHAHRVSFLDLEEDLRTLSEDLGVKNVRVPLSWCLTDYDPTTITGGEDEEVLKERFTCLDPFYEEEGVRWPAVPKSLLSNFLRACAKHGISAVLDVHTYPGGTSIGTFSGVWPRWSRFWTHGDAPAMDDSNKKDVGRELFQNFISWVESLATEDPKAFEGLRGVSPMNEPAHLAGLYFGEEGDPIFDPSEEFLPELPEEMAESFLAELNDNCEGYKCTKIPNGNHLRVLLWLRDATETFRSSSLPSLGKQMHMNIHESVFSFSDFKALYDDPEKVKMHTIASWWRGITTPEERKTWAILDVHHYHAWDEGCSGTSDGPPFGNYTCSDHSAKMETLSRCASWALVYRKAVDKECGKGTKLASAEFSASTHHSVLRACNDVGTLRQTYKLQTESARDADVELFWWSYKMPYGGAFRNAWSFKHLMFLLGVLHHPDESNYACNHIAAEGEPKNEILS
mmetsp:Transcript_7727/g.10546  ORF Transcript_7727/g.10546 Transcript_7727/m.10546 type:complete len:641 (-) Transcript_7727:205-2127(-)